MRTTEKGNLSKAFGTVLKAERLKKGISQEELAFRCDLNRTYISSLERGLKNPTLHIAWIIAQGLGVPLHILIETSELIISTKI